MRLQIQISIPAIYSVARMHTHRSMSEDEKRHDADDGTGDEGDDQDFG